MRHRQGCRLGAREAAAATVHQGADAVSIGEGHVAHPHRVTHPQVGVIQQAHSPAYEHRRRVASLGTGITFQGIPCRAQHACQGRAVSLGQRCTPLAVRFSKVNSTDFGVADLSTHAKTQLRHSISRIEHDPAVAIRQQIGKAATGDNHHHGADGMSRHYLRVHPCHHLAVDEHGTIGTATHHVVTTHRQQTFITANRGNRRRLSRHLQGFFALAQVLRQASLTWPCRLTIGARHQSPGNDPEFIHFSVFHGQLSYI